MKVRFVPRALLSAGLLAAVPAMLDGSNAPVSIAQPELGSMNVQSSDKWMVDWTSIAVVRGVDRIALTHVGNLLKSNGIECTSFGSLSYGVLVERADADRAKRILIDDATQNTYWLRVGDKSFEPAAKTIAVQIDLRPDEYGRIQTNPRNPYIERFVREAYISLEPTPSHKTTAQPKWDFVKRIDMAKRRYLDYDGHWSVGYDCTVEFGSTGSQKAYFKYNGYVWDEGKQCQISGGIGVYG